MTMRKLRMMLLFFFSLKDDFVNQSGKKGCSCRMNFKTALIDWTICLHYKGKIFCEVAFEYYPARDFHEFSLEQNLSLNNFF